MRIFLIGFLVLVLTGCQATSSGIGAKVNTSSSNTKSIEVLDLNFTDAIDLAHEAAINAYKNVSIPDRDRTKILIDNRSFWQGDAQAMIDPVLVQDKDSKRIGIVFQVVAVGVGSNFSFAPGYVSKGFFNALAPLVNEREIETFTFNNYTKLKEKGIADKIAASIPTDQVQFRKFVDGMDTRDPFVGIWEADDGDYTLGMIRDKNDPIYSYKMFIIASRYKNWSPGEVKIKFTRLDEDGLAVGKYLGQRKDEAGLTFETNRGTLISLNSPFNTQVILIKTYPRKRSTARGSTGTSWYVGDRYFVTNAHVVEGANEIDLMIGGEETPARVAAIDRRLDIAILRTKTDPSLSAIPVNGQVSTGEKVTVIGFPLGEGLGNSPKVTDGLLSGMNGLEGDPTRYLVSAPIQPGNSGGPVFGSNGYAVGVAVSKYVSDMTDNVGFAVKAQYVLPLLEELGVKIAEPPSAPLNPKQLCDKYCASVIQVRSK